MKKKLSKSDKNSFDIISTFYHILSLSDNNNFVRNNFERLKDIVSSGYDQQELNSFIEEIKSDGAFKQIKNIDLGEGQTPEKFLSEYGSSLPTFLGDFDKITNVENSLDFETLDYTCSRDLMAEMWPEYSEYLAKYDEAYMTYKDAESGLNIGEIKARKNIEKVERFNSGMYPENSFEIGQDMVTVATTAGVLVFPPLVIVSGILFLLKANKNTLIEAATNFASEKKKKFTDYIQKSGQRKMDNQFGEFMKEINERKDRVQELKSSLPKPWEKIVESAVLPNMYLYDRLMNIKKYQEQLTLCNTNMGERFMTHQPRLVKA